MAIRQYIGARYVPRFMDTYNSTQQYEVLDVVDNGLGTSYILKKPAPIGTPLTDTEYWSVYGASSGAVINLQNQIDDLRNIVVSGFTNVLTLGVKNDGSVDCSSIINAHSTEPLYFPTGVYRFDSTIHPENSIIGDGVPRNWLVNKFSGTVFKFTMVDASTAIQYSSNLSGQSIEIGNISIELDPTNTGIVLDLNTDNSLFYVHDLNMINAFKGIYCRPTVGSSRYLHAFNVTIWGIYNNPKVGSYGILMNANAYDSELFKVYIFALQIGVECAANSCKFDNLMIWTAGGTNSAIYYDDTKCINVKCRNLIVSNTYFDTARYPIYCEATAKSLQIIGCNAYWGDYASLVSFATPVFVYLASKTTMVYISDFYIQCPFAAWSISNHIECINGMPIVSSYAYGSTYSAARCVYSSDGECYNNAIDTTNGTYQEVARVGRWAMLLIQSEAGIVVVRCEGPDIKYSKIGPGFDVFYKIDAANNQVRVYCNFGSNGNLFVKPLTVGVVNMNKTLYGDEKIALDIQSDATGLTAATLVTIVNP